MQSGCRSNGCSHASTQQQIHLAVQAIFIVALWSQLWCCRCQSFRATVSAYLFGTDAERQVPHKDDPATCTQQHQLPIATPGACPTSSTCMELRPHLLTSGGRRAVRLAAAAAMARLLGCAAAHTSCCRCCCSDAEGCWGDAEQPQASNQIQKPMLRRTISTTPSLAHTLPL